MATDQVFLRSSSGPTERLVTILSGSLPELPSDEVHRVAAELRMMTSERAAEVWRHPGWAAVVSWIHQWVPECDPTIAAVHAVRNAERASMDPKYARSLASYVRQIAHRSSVEERRRDRQTEELTWDPEEPPRGPARPIDSLADDAAGLLSACGLTVSEAAWRLIGPSIDLAVDWWDDLAVRTGRVGLDLVVAARHSKQMSGEQRLRARFDGPAARALVALLLGGDQQGRRARRAAGTEAGLVYWSVLARRASTRHESRPVPPAPIRRAWATHIGGIEQTIEPSGPAVGPTALQRLPSEAYWPTGVHDLQGPEQYIATGSGPFGEH